MCALSWYSPNSLLLQLYEAISPFQKLSLTKINKWVSWSSGDLRPGLPSLHMAFPSTATPLALQMIPIPSSLTDTNPYITHKTSVRLFSRKRSCTDKRKHALRVIAYPFFPLAKKKNHARLSKSGKYVSLCVLWPQISKFWQLPWRARAAMYKALLWALSARLPCNESAATKQSTKL